MDMSCDPGSAATGTQCDTTSAVRCGAERDLSSIDSDDERGRNWQRQHHFYDGCKKQ